MGGVGRLDTLVSEGSNVVHMSDCLSFIRSVELNCLKNHGQIYMSPGRKKLSVIGHAERKHKNGYVCGYSVAVSHVTIVSSRPM